MTQIFLQNFFTPRVDVCLIRSKANERLLRRKNCAAGKNTGSPTATAARRVKVVSKKLHTESTTTKKSNSRTENTEKRRFFRSFSSFPPEKSQEKSHTHAQSLSESIFPPHWLGFLLRDLTLDFRVDMRMMFRQRSIAHNNSEISEIPDEHVTCNDFCLLWH